MVREAIPVDVSDMPNLSRLAREVADTGTVRVLSEHGRVLARLTPATKRRRSGQATTRAELLQVLADTHGAWDGLVNADALKRERERLQVDEREPREL